MQIPLHFYVIFYLENPTYEFLKTENNSRNNIKNRFGKVIYTFYKFDISQKKCSKCETTIRGLFKNAQTV